MADKTANIYYRHYLGSYAKNTQHLRTAEEHGAYRLLLDRYYTERQPLPDDDDFLSRVAMVPLKRWQKTLRPLLAPFFVVQAGVWRQTRCDEEIGEAGDAYKKQCNSAVITNWKKENNRRSNSGLPPLPMPELPYPEVAPRTVTVRSPSPDGTVTDTTTARLPHDNQPTTNNQQPSSYREERERREAESQKDEGQGPEPEVRPGQIPPMSRGLFMASAEMRGITPECAEYWWNEWDGQNWADGKGGIIANPMSWLTNRAKSWRAIEEQRKTAAKTPGGARPDSAYGLKQRIDALNAQRERCDRSTKEGRAEVMDLNRRIEELQRELGGNS